MHITITEKEIHVIADAGWDEEEYAQKIRDHGLWDEMVTYVDYHADDNGETWILGRGQA